MAVSAAAELGFKVETSGLVKGKQSLDQITDAAGKTEARVSSLAKVMSSVGKTFAAAALGMTRSIESLVSVMDPYNISQRAAATEARRFAESVYEAAKAEDALASSFQRTAKAAEKRTREFKKSMQTAESKGSSRFYTGNIVAQFQDIGVTAAMGMNPLTIALQQGTQLSAVLESMENPIQGLISGFKSLFSSVSLMTVGLTALSVVGLQMVDWTRVGQIALNGFAGALDFTADHVTALAGALGLLGLATLPSVLGSLTVGFTALGTTLALASKAALAFVASGFLTVISGLANPIGILTVLAISAATAFLKMAEGLNTINAVAKVLKGTLNSLIGAFAASTAGAVAFLNIFRGGKLSDIKKAVDDALNADYVAQFADKLHSAADAVRNYGKATEEVKNPWENIYSYIDQTTRSLQLETDLIGKNAWESEQLRYNFELTNRAISAGLDPLNDRLTAIKLENKALSLTMEKMKLLDKQQDFAYQDFITGVNKSVDSLKSLQQQMFMTSEELYTYKAREDLLNQAQAKGITLGESRLKEIDALAVGIGKQKADYDKLSSSISTATSLTSGFFIDMKNGLAQGQSAWEAFGTAVTNVLNNIADALIQFATQRMVLGIAANMMTPTAGAVNAGNTATVTSAGLSGGVGNMNLRTGFAKGGIFTNQIVDSPTVFKFAKGSRFGVMGEAGPEAVMPLTRSADGSLGVRSVGKSQETVVVNVINNSNASARTEERQTTHGKEIDVIIDQLVSQKINQQGSSTNRALTAYNNQKLISR